MTFFLEGGAEAELIMLFLPLDFKLKNNYFQPGIFWDKTKGDVGKAEAGNVGLWSRDGKDPESRIPSGLGGRESKCQRPRVERQQRNPE